MKHGQHRLHTNHAVWHACRSHYRLRLSPPWNPGAFVGTRSLFSTNIKLHHAGAVRSLPIQRQHAETDSTCTLLHRGRWGLRVPTTAFTRAYHRDSPRVVVILDDRNISRGERNHAHGKAKAKASPYLPFSHDSVPFRSSLLLCSDNGGRGLVLLLPQRAAKVTEGRMQSMSTTIYCEV